jgi:hypothetical protein
MVFGWHLMQFPASSCNHGSPAYHAQEG